MGPCMNSLLSQTCDCIGIEKLKGYYRLAIAPWNAPISLSFRAIAIPLICGNTVVLKSSEYSPRAQEIVVEIMHEVRRYV